MIQNQFKQPLLSKALLNKTQPMQSPRLHYFPLISKSLSTPYFGNRKSMQAESIQKATPSPQTSLPKLFLQKGQSI